MSVPTVERAESGGPGFKYQEVRRLRLSPFAHLMSIIYGLSQTWGYGLIVILN